MSFATVYSRARVGIDAPLVTIEVHISNGLPAFQIVGLPETSVREARDRVRSALINSNFQFPQTRITVNLAPADLPKEGGRFDLPIAIGILTATGQIPLLQLEQYEFYGELGLKGDLRDIVGEIPSALACSKHKRIAVLPKGNAIKATIIGEQHLVAGESLLHVFHHVIGQHQIPLLQQQVIEPQNSPTDIDLSDVIGQYTAKRALEIAAAGQHNLLFLGPPGTGKSMLAQRLLGLLPDLSMDEALQTSAIHSVSGKPFDIEHWKKRPFRSPHHTASGVALVGGGSVPKPGEISLAHNGVLFLDELPEFDRKVLDVLREPLETGKICISRAAQQAEFPAQFQLIAALNPSPTGHHTDGRANSDQVLKYLNKISGPFMDRIDLQIDVPLLPPGALANKTNKGETTASVKERVLNARYNMLRRCDTPNALLNNQQIRTFCPLSDDDQTFLEAHINKLNLSIRTYHKIIKVARTIADLHDEKHITRAHLAEALSYRAMDRLISQLTK